MVVVLDRVVVVVVVVVVVLVPLLAICARFEIKSNLDFIYIYLIETRSIQEYSIRCTLSRVNTKDVVVVVYVVVRLVFRFSLLLLSSQRTLNLSSARLYTLRRV